MHCTRCGQPLADGATFCSKCGLSMSGPTFCPRCGQVMAPNASFCSNCGMTFQQNQAYQPAYQQPQQQFYQHPYQPQYPPYPAPLGMGWYNFLVKFGLGANAAVNGLFGLLFLAVGFQPINLTTLFVGILSLAACVFSILIRKALAEYKTNGPRRLQWLHLGNIGGNFIWCLIIVLEEGIFIPDASAASAIGYILGVIVGLIIATALLSLLPICLYFCHKTYFKKRAHLFVN